MLFKINTGPKIYTTPPPLAPLILLSSLALIIIDPAIFHAFITTRMPLPDALRAPCFNSANIIDFIEKYEKTCNDFSILKDDRYQRLEKLLSHLLSGLRKAYFYALLKQDRIKPLVPSRIARRNPKQNNQALQDIRTLVKEHTEPASVLKSAKKALVVVPFTREPRFTNKKEEIDKTKSLTQLLDALFNLNLKFDSKTATKPLLSIPLKMLEVKSASKEEFRLLLSATNYKDEEKKEVKDTRARCKIIASAKTPKTQLKLFINTGMSVKLLKIYIKVASVEINAAAKDKAKKSLLASEGSKPIKIKKNIRQQKEKNYGTLKAPKADEAMEDVKGEVKIIQRVLRERKKRTYKREKFINLYVTTKA
ncbi:hypothetical protein MBM_05225 [Drepanopeziza brunnea f. sp. 'multigermtubi' MB_m1]|uniref:Uncharacterized protein n=1 Tax=Marssonina brunnea f. sp. multigermtubi (strain MB_m1) TaxID=1072389 RepID=K1WUP3_MARBU|nr:uncharacterized protein MBM_05225 [Drepanopeziza brunnea f. sp. 'multigermtubi' MB_m1]EKD16756.1 hypothetical protein MBM_05225 [Drepanopeziza brunnea f. sp. 'multigermtubi' MB_m1]